MKTPAFERTYDGRRVLDMPAFEFEPGKIYAVIGANGSGKTTLARILSGIEKPDGGKSPAAGADVSYMPQKSFAFRMSARDNVLLGGKDAERADALMRRLAIDGLADKNAKRLSGGETARMALARILMHPCELLVLDEPTAAMDMKSTAVSEELIREFRGETGCAVLLITHSLRQAKRVSDEMLFFSGGELVEHGRMAELLLNPQTEKLKSFLEFYGT